MSMPSMEVFRHNYHELTDVGRALYMVAVKPKWDERQQFFFEGCRDLPGQMYMADRRALFEAILKRRPRQCFEIGTYLGGGSTYFLASAFRQLGAGQVVTLEAEQNNYALAAGYYARYLPELNPHVKFLLGGDPALFLPHIDPEQGVDSLFLDGSSDGEETFGQLRFFEPHCRPGTLLLAHDWDTEKQRLVRPYLENSPDWQLDQYIGEPDSIGYAAYIRR
ncbi:hypothetical protein GBZ48_19125 [Azospirillum melinis]|uniref:Class I SAM-dependent methyltransferase n=1 Tax=Azospirillum melinis TaxID=328839 RepID=A0ABX2KL14_9PROT|nr:class I SAM-dependent methyltransferase [Azospirillum melinis]MBP2307311.1 cephalosporin hydroxylase [Azospirillum melinis]NUB01375.1 hypothetical protein [Azospirillum melinis]